MERDTVTLIMSPYDYSRLVTATKRYSEVLDSAKKFYRRKSGKELDYVGRSSCTTIFHLLNLPVPEKGKTTINLCDYSPIPPPSYQPKNPRKKE